MTGSSSMIRISVVTLMFHSFVGGRRREGRDGPSLGTPRPGADFAQRRLRVDYEVTVLNVTSVTKADRLGYSPSHGDGYEYGSARATDGLGARPCHRRRSHDSGSDCRISRQARFS